MKLFIKTCLILFAVFFIGCHDINTVSSQTILQGSVEKVPDGFFGSWNVVSKLIETDSPATFKQKGIDIWNLYTEHDVIILCNPFSGARAKISISNDGSPIKTQTAKYVIKGERISGQDIIVK